jgi:predicted TIM-barrel fold metal-dependent hydrolase
MTRTEERRSSPFDSLVSADSHVVEPVEIWRGVLPDRVVDAGFGEEFNVHPGGASPESRLMAMAEDGVVAEVLYPSRALPLFALEDAETQEECFRRYNDWLAEFCAPAPDRLLGVALLSVYDVDHAVDELARVHALGLRGVQIWQSPHPDLPLHSSHYDRLWQRAQTLSMPLSLHVLTGFDFSRKFSLTALAAEDVRPIWRVPASGADRAARAAAVARDLVSAMTLSASDAVMELLAGDVLERFPALRVVLVENEIGWLPHALERLDHCWARWNPDVDDPAATQPSARFGEQLFATFIRDRVGTRMLAWWGARGCMWSNDFPHSSSTWPHSHAVVAELLASLPLDVVDACLRENAMRLYAIETLPAPVAQP